MSLIGASHAGIVKVITDMFDLESGALRTPQGTICTADLEKMEKAAKQVKVAKREEEHRVRDELMSSRDQTLAISHGKRFSDDGVEESRASGLENRVLPEYVCGFMHEDKGHSSSTEVGPALDLFTGEQNIPKCVLGINGGFHNRVLRGRVVIGLNAGAYTFATGASVPVPDGGTSDENAGIIASALHRDIVPPDSIDLSDTEAFSSTGVAPMIADKPPQCWNLNHFGEIFDLPVN